VTEKGQGSAKDHPSTDLTSTDRCEKTITSRTFAPGSERENIDELVLDVELSLCGDISKRRELGGCPRLPGIEERPSSSVVSACVHQSSPSSRLLLVLLPLLASASCGLRCRRRIPRLQNEILIVELFIIVDHVVVGDEQLGIDLSSNASIQIPDSGAEEGEDRRESPRDRFSIGLVVP